MDVIVNVEVFLRLWFWFVEVVFEIGKFVLQKGVCVVDCLVVDWRVEFFDEEVEQVFGLKGIDVFVEFVGEVVFDFVQKVFVFFFVDLDFYCCYVVFFLLLYVLLCRFC